MSLPLRRHGAVPKSLVISLSDITRKACSDIVRYSSNKFFAISFFFHGVAVDKKTTSEPKSSDVVFLGDPSGNSRNPRNASLAPQV